MLVAVAEAEAGVVGVAEGRIGEVSVRGGMREEGAAVVVGRVEDGRKDAWGG